MPLGLFFIIIAETLPTHREGMGPEVFWFARNWRMIGLGLACK
jgi:hypothetical protein